MRRIVSGSFLNYLVFTAVPGVLWDTLAFILLQILLFSAFHLLKEGTLFFGITGNIFVWFGFFAFVAYRRSIPEKISPLLKTGTGTYGIGRHSFEIDEISSVEEMRTEGFLRAKVHYYRIQIRKILVSGKDREEVTYSHHLVDRKSFLDWALLNFGSRRKIPEERVIPYLLKKGLDPCRVNQLGKK